MLSKLRKISLVVKVKKAVHLRRHSNQIMVHKKYMQRCFELALGGHGFVAPNPLVGGVFGVDDRIISEGYHHKFGGAHAEVEALKNITDIALLKKGTLY